MAIGHGRGERTQQLGISSKRLPLGSGVYHFCPISLPKASHMAKTNSKEPGAIQSSCREMGESRYSQGTSGICFTKKSKFTLVLPMKFSTMARAEARVQGPQNLFHIFWHSGSGLRSPCHRLRLVLLGFVYGLAISRLPFQSSFIISCNRPSNIYWVFPVWQALSWRLGYKI